MSEDQWKRGEAPVFHLHDAAKAVARLDVGLSHAILVLGCRGFRQSRTLEGWAAQIGRSCANQWKLRFEEGKLVA